MALHALRLSATAQRGIGHVNSHMKKRVVIQTSLHRGDRVTVINTTKVLLFTKGPVEWRFISGSKKTKAVGARALQ
jgi:hypothetical protein